MTENDDPRAEAREQTVREQAIEAGARAILAHEKGGTVTRTLAAIAVIAAVEPIIRADERDQALEEAERIAHLEHRLTRVEAEVRERLRAQVEALPRPMVGRTTVDLVFRAAVLTLLDGEPDADSSD